MIIFIEHVVNQFNISSFSVAAVVVVLSFGGFRSNTTKSYISRASIVYISCACAIVTQHIHRANAFGIRFTTAISMNFLGCVNLSTLITHMHRVARTHIPSDCGGGAQVQHKTVSERERTRKTDRKNNGWLKCIYRVTCNWKSFFEWQPHPHQLPHSNIKIAFRICNGKSWTFNWQDIVLQSVDIPPELSSMFELKSSETGILFRKLISMHSFRTWTFPYLTKNPKNVIRLIQDAKIIWKTFNFRYSEERLNPCIETTTFISPSPPSSQYFWQWIPHSVM